VGRQEWLRAFESGFIDYVYDATVTADGRIVIVGESYPDNHPDTTGPDGWVVIVDSAGNMIRNQIYGRTIKIRFWNVQVAPDGGLLLSGETSEKVFPWRHNDLLLMRISESGDSLWSRRKSDGWEEADSCVTTDGDKLPFGYLDRAIHVESPHHISPLVVETKLGGIFDWLRSQGCTGRISGGGAGAVSDGYFYAGTLTHPLPKDSTASPEQR
jgi:hypothetical protein